MISKSEHLLAALIFVLWSLGIVLLPALGAYGGAYIPSSIPTWWSLWYAYLALHGVTFVFAGYSLFDRLRRGAHGFLPLALYVYTVGMLCVSIYLLIQSIPGI